MNDVIEGEVALSPAVPAASWPRTDYLAGAVRDAVKREQVGT